MSPIDMIYLPLQRLNGALILLHSDCEPLIGIFPYFFSMEIPLLPTLISMPAVFCTPSDSRECCLRADGYSVVFPSKCSSSASASALVACTTPSRWFGGA